MLLEILTFCEQVFIKHVIFWFSLQKHTDEWLSSHQQQLQKNVSFIHSFGGAAWLFFLAFYEDNSRSNTQTILSNRCIPCNKTYTNLETQRTQCTLSFGAFPPDSGRWDAGIGTPQLPTSGCCSSTGKRLHLLPPTTPWSLLRAPLPARSWRWRRQTEPGSSLWVRETERCSREWERERESHVCVAAWCSL